VEKDVEVAVCRQFTTRQTGYHTDYSDRQRVLGTAMALAQQALGVPASGRAHIKAATKVPRRRMLERPPRRT
jgi:hypothetical protein